MPLPFDATLKSIVAGRPADFAVVFGLPMSEPVSSINVDLSMLTAATDVALAYGDPVRLIVDLNFQSGSDPELPVRLLNYNVVLNRKYKVPVHTIAVLLRPKADGANLDGSHSYGNARSGIEFRYEIIRLWNQPVESYLHAGLGTLPLTMLCQMPAGQPLSQGLREVVREIDRRLGREANDAEAAVILKATHVLAGLRVKKTELPSIFQGVGLMSELTAYDELLEIEERGEQRGRLQGQISTSHHLLLLLGRKQFGEPDSEVEEALTSIQDLARLERLATAILTAKSWQELLATP